MAEDGDDTPASYARDDHAAATASPRSRTAARAALRPKVHCVRLQWSDHDDDEQDGDCD